ncbi:hypothetical protein EW026_g2557 [Hermanssonia centrifuga]|uniref:Transcription initiation factor TFIID subunit 1 histone acetyltransferase domain-containing protein n=1 Tax=Hermanssonia centrifuga TaxID=98765 RepID=A0A4S4KMW4_9APHY|nr:hypothetical protein EW026_g2557 [Hermanssonia centrifuga]
MADENDAIAALTGFTLDNVLSGLDLPTGPGLSNQLGISGVSGFSSTQIYNDKWDDQDAIGPGEGEDWEDEVDRELEEEEDDGAPVKIEMESPRMGKKEKRKRVIRRLVERPKTVYERFPTFERDKVLDFTELFKGYTVQKSRISKRSFYVEPVVYTRKKEAPKGFLEALVGEAEREVEHQRVEQVVASGSIEQDLRHALEERAKSNVPISLPLHDRSFDLVLLSNWEDQIIYEPAMEFKTRLSKQEARSFHRPALQFPSNIELRFSKVRTAKKKKDKAGRKVGKGGNVGEGLHKTGDLSLRDTSNFVLWELSEEHPPIISNFGMGSILVNYYRKKNDKDDHIPKYDLGEPIVIEPQDESPFMKFGYVYPGQTIPALYNNLMRAPLFRHKPYPTDFLVIKSTVKNDTKYFIREIKNLFAVGQTYPVTEVPGPHSRKITNTIKHRLQIIAYKLLSKSAEERLKISRLMKYFPDQNELQMRQRLKEFMEYHRRGPHQGFWRLKTNWVVPPETEQLKLVTPEQVVLSESMQVGQRHLQDSGYSYNGEVAEGDEDNLSVEQQLAPWITTKNFLFATQAKAMLRLHGEGDPSGRGEAFSFIRVSMKDIFVKAGEDYEKKLGKLSITLPIFLWQLTFCKAEAESRPKSAHRYNVAEQQVIYKSEIERIWKAQFDSLSRKDEPELTKEEEEAAKDEPKKTGRRESMAQHSAAGYTPAQSPMRHTPGPTSPTFSRGSSLAREQDLVADQRKVLRIKRLVNGEWKTEIIRDVAVINAYVKKRQTMEEENTTADALAPTGDAEKDKRAKKRLEEEIARMKKNQERRLHRKNAKIVKEGGTPMQLNRPVKPDTTPHQQRRCGHCGQMGHMKTNRKCPRWAEFNSGAPPPTPSTSAASPPATSPTEFGKGSESLFSPGASSNSLRPPGTLLAHGPSPLAMSPPVTAMDEDDDDDGDFPPPTPSAAPKIKLTLKKS